MVESLFHTSSWALALFSLNAIGWLALRSATSKWHDLGWAMARPLALLAFAYVIWLGGQIAPIFRADLLWVFMLVIAGSVLILARRRGLLAVDRTALRCLVVAELRFTLPFAFYTAMRGFNHDIVGLEKFMDFAFMNSAMASASLPVADPWFSGESINYYYFGHYVAALLSKLSGTPAAHGYNLMLATLFGCTFQLAYAFVAEMTRRLNGSASAAMALVAGTWITIGGNVHGFVYGLIRPLMVDAGFVDAPRQAFLISDATRFVGYDPLTSDKLIHEFPAYAFYVGDLHAHLSNLPGVLLLFCVLLAWFRSRADGVPGKAAARAWLLVSAWLVGLFAISNSWDALMYGSLLGTILLTNFVFALRHGRPAVLSALGDGATSALVIGATALPFLLVFHTYSAGFMPTHSHTPIGQWLVLYGLQAALAAIGCLIAFRRRYVLLSRPDLSLLTILTMFGLAFALVPEFVYLKDIYGDDYYRANTAFKFGFQAFAVLTLCACVGTALLPAVFAASVPRALVLILLELCLVPPLYYGWFFVHGGFSFWREREWTLDGQRYLALSHSEDWAAIRWLAVQSAGSRRPIVEAVGDSYSFGARISSNTGVPAIIGWPVHEQLWRGSDPEVWQRRDDVGRLYETTSLDEAKRVLERYRPRWLIVGRYERERYPKINVELLASLGRVIFRAGETFIVDLDLGQD